MRKQRLRSRDSSMKLSRTPSQIAGTYRSRTNVEAHKSLGLLLCRYSSSTVIIFCPSDRHGIWELQREESNAKGILPQYAFEPLYRIAEEKGLYSRPRL